MVAQPSASSLFQRQIMLQAAPSSGPIIAKWAAPGRPYRACFRHSSSRIARLAQCSSVSLRTCWLRTMHVDAADGRRCRSSWLSLLSTCSHIALCGTPCLCTSSMESTGPVYAPFASIASVLARASGLVAPEIALSPRERRRPRIAARLYAAAARGGQRGEEKRRNRLKIAVGAGRRRTGTALLGPRGVACRVSSWLVSSRQKRASQLTVLPWKCQPLARCTLCRHPAVPFASLDQF